MARPRYVARGVDLFPARTPTLPPATHTNSYALGSREVILVEPATPHDDEQRAFVEWARALESAGRKLVAIVMTHHHRDHVGGAEFFSRELGLPLWAHEETASLLPDLRIDRHLREGEEIRLEGDVPSVWRVMHTPGHAPGHVCLHEPVMKTVIVGDMVASVGTIVVSPTEGDMTAYLRELRRLESLGAEVALPAHGEPIEKSTFGHSPSELFAHYVQHRLKREGKVVAALEGTKESGASVEELGPTVYAETPVMMWPIAKLSLEAHLIKLEREGRAKRAGEGWAKV